MSNTQVIPSVKMDVVVGVVMALTVKIDWSPTSLIEAYGHNNHLS